jgi:hypothetical protein
VLGALAAEVEAVYPMSCKPSEIHVARQKDNVRKAGTQEHESYNGEVEWLSHNDHDVKEIHAQKCRDTHDNVFILNRISLMPVLFCLASRTSVCQDIALSANPQCLVKKPA